jgi:NADH:ubiquinone oxidoreductase subunit E
MKITNQLNEEIGLENIKSCDVLPCHLEGKYYINGVFLSESDFGDGYDNRDYDNDVSVSEEIACWGCINRVFERHTDDKLVNKAMKEYGITREEFDLIADRLEDLLYVGMCGWCV